MNSYRLQRPGYYRTLFDGSDRLFAACWRQYREYLNGGIDDPSCDADVIDWLDALASEKVNNPRSTFYIYG